MSSPTSLQSAHRASSSGPRRPPDSGRSPASDAIHVWRASLALDDRGYARLYDTLSVDERDRASSFLFDRDRRRFVAARGALREILGRYLGTAPHRLRFRLGPLGKPAIAGDLPHFSVSHSGELALFAISRSTEVGVDLERVRPVVHLERIVERFFSARERQAFSGCPADRREHVFFECWTRKEAWLKARGEGLAGLVESNAAGEGCWIVRSLAADPGYVAALAERDSTAGARCVEYRVWSDGLDVD